MAAIFVFGSNLGGIHGAGSALEAKRNWGAIQGLGTGPQGSSYAIPTKECSVRYVMPLSRIRLYVDQFIRYAKEHPDDTFNVVAIGCGLSGYKPQQIAPLFHDSPQNVNLPDEFISYLATMEQGRG